MRLGLRERLRAARAEEVRVREQITKLRRGEKPDFELPPILQQLAQESGKNRAFKLEAILQLWALYAVGTTMTIGHKELSEYAEVSLEAAKASRYGGYRFTRFHGCNGTPFGPDHRGAKKVRGRPS